VTSVLAHAQVLTSPVALVVSLDLLNEIDEWARIHGATTNRRHTRGGSGTSLVISFPGNAPRTIHLDTHTLRVVHSHASFSMALHHGRPDSIAGELGAWIISQRAADLALQVMQLNGPQIHRRQRVTISHPHLDGLPQFTNPGRCESVDLMAAIQHGITVARNAAS
jgi:hypothetical protein